MQRAYVLIETTVGTSEDVLGVLRQVSGIAMANTVAGPYDIIAVVHGPNVNNVKIVLNKVRGIPGINKTMTCLAMDD